VSESGEVQKPEDCSGCADGCAGCDPCIFYGCYGAEGAWNDPAVRQAVRETIAKGGDK
jgi:hypothetical protein